MHAGTGENNKTHKMKKIVAIRIRGLVGITEDLKRTIDVLRLRKKFSCVVLNEEPNIIGMVKKVENNICFGEIDKETFKLLVLKRGRLIGDKKLQIKEDALNKFVDNFFENKAKLEDLKLKPFFRLHPPKGGFKKSTKKFYPEGVLGKNEKIKELIKKML